MRFKSLISSSSALMALSAASQTIRRSLLLLAVTGLLAACSPNEVPDDPTVPGIATASTLAPALPPAESATPAIAPTNQPQETEVAQAIPPTFTSMPSPTTTATSAAEPSASADPASPVIKIPLAGPVANSQAELSGLAWYGDNLILLPQYPDFHSDTGDGFLYALPKVEIISFLTGTISPPLEPRPIPFIAPGLRDSIAGFEGYEAITFLGDAVYITIESRTAGGMLGYLAKGAIAPDLSALTLDTSTLVPIGPQTAIENMSEEGIFTTDQVVGTIYELNGRGINPSPVVHLFDLDLRPLEAASFPHLEFRLTDASEVDQDGRFWTINYFFPGTGEITDEPPDGEENDDQSRLPWQGMGRLVELQFTPSGITLTGSAPIQLETLLSDIHNWEGLVRLDDQGFLLVSDEFPDTVLGFVPSQEVE